jgi:TetR/AcrR family transcriptional regulator
MARPRSNIAPRIVHAARDRFLKHGVDGASLREIARAARTSVGMVHYYFPTKDDLLLAVIEEVYGALSGDIREALDPGATVEERLRRLYTRIAAMSDEEFTVVRIVLREALVSSGRLKKVFARFTAEGAHVPLIAGAVMEGIQSGALRDDVNPLFLLVATVALAFIPVVGRRLAQGALPDLQLPPPGEMANGLLQALLTGIGGAKVRRKADLG